MANEIQVRSSITITKALDANNTYQEKYQSPVQGFTKSKDNVGGPTPGMLTVPVTGIAVDLSAIGTPGLCEITNKDPTNFVTVGIKDPLIEDFYPMLEIGPGESWVVPLSRSIREDWSTTGTGTTGKIKQLWAEANVAACKVVFNVFEK